MATTKKTEEVKATKTTETTASAPAAKATEEKAAETKAAKKPETKATAKKTEAKKAPCKKAPAKKAEISKSVVVEFAGKQTAADEIVDKCIAAFKAENKGKSVKSVEIYIKPDENVAYYVINGVAEGKYVEL